ncbi:CCNB3-like protein [Mya arenaria]|uniref:CCNB3-like protein n=1 Tax=Mya arenaria TaxID=6604 RepID=A0ABY7G1U7_MYAAR|nr:CCNB3-like protein [Mya arenaria]
MRSRPYGRSTCLLHLFRVKQLAQQQGNDREICYRIPHRKDALSDKENIKIALKKSKLPTTAGGLVKPVLPGKKITKENKPLKKKDRPQKVPSNENLTDESSLSLLISSQESNSSGSSSQESIVCQGVEDLVPLDDTEDKVLEGIDDVDKENLQDPVQVALYAFHIFEYYKERELLFKVEPYMSSQRFLTSSMRAILVDWLVEVQENFELNHETLYLAVKLVDMYMSTITTPKESVQLVGAVALFIAAKFDERCPPLVEDFLYICDDAYKRTEFLDMERAILHAVGFDIGMPLSYRFLRRYAKCNRANMETLTLGRYILEMSLMEYDFVPRRESEMAAAALFLALRMKNTGTWEKIVNDSLYWGIVISHLIVSSFRAILHLRIFKLTVFLLHNLNTFVIQLTAEFYDPGCLEEKSNSGPHV